jgi:hypothetical protein
MTSESNATDGRTTTTPHHTEAMEIAQDFKAEAKFGRGGRDEEPSPYTHPESVANPAWGLEPPSPCTPLEPPQPPPPHTHIFHP